MQSAQGHANLLLDLCLFPAWGMQRCFNMSYLSLGTASKRMLTAFQVYSFKLCGILGKSGERSCPPIAEVQHIEVHPSFWPNKGRKSVVQPLGIFTPASAQAASFRIASCCEAVALVLIFKIDYYINVLNLSLIRFSSLTCASCSSPLEVQSGSVSIIG